MPLPTLAGEGEETFSRPPPRKYDLYRLILLPSWWRVMSLMLSALDWSGWKGGWR